MIYKSLLRDELKNELPNFLLDQMENRNCIFLEAEK